MDCPFTNNLSLDFVNDNYVVIREGKSRSKYFFADPNVIITPPEKEINLPSEDVCFELSTDQLDKLLKAAAVYGLPSICAVGDAELCGWLLPIREVILLTNTLL